MNKFSDLLIRFVVGLIGAAVILTSVVFSPWTLFGLGMIILIFCLREYVRLADLPRLLVLWSFVGSVLIYSIIFLIAYEGISTDYVFLILPIAFIGLVFQLFETSSLPLRSMALHFLGYGYIAMPLSFFSYLSLDGSGFTYEYLVGLFILIWCMDSGAYFAGSAFGKHKLFERVSPKKTWEGAFGGLVLTLIGAYLLSLFFVRLSTIEWTLAGVVIVVVGLFGDLLESYMKRISARKDSGSSLPGHGGFLDRFDSILFAVPFYLALIKFLS